MTEEKNTIDFGFKTVAAEEKAGMVRGVFDSVADNYDLMNDFMSMGIHRIWKTTLQDRLAPRPGQCLIDVAGGTGDVGTGFVKRANEWAALNRDATLSQKPPAHAFLCDINHAMLKAGRTNRDNPYREQLSHICGDAENLPLESNLADAYTIAFGIRNVTNMDNALKQAYRVLKPGGRFICLEFSHPITKSFQKFYDEYSFKAIPWLGEKIANDRASYQYLVESIRRFPTQEAFATRISEAGFSRVTFENLSGGIAALHMAWRI